MRTKNDAKLRARRFVDSIRKTHHVALWFTKTDGSREHIVELLSWSKKPDTLHDELLIRGAAVPRDSRPGTTAVREALDKMDDHEEGRLFSRPGWHDEVFLRPDAPPLKDSSKVLIPPEVAKAARAEFKTSGTLASWRSDVAVLALHSTYVAFAIAVALAAPLSRRVEGVAEGAIFNFTGPSSTGKTTALRAAISTYGRPAEIPGWNVTPRALAERARQMSDMPLVLDDMQNMQVGHGQRRSARIRSAAHALAGGQSIRYADVVRETLPDLDWWCWGLSTNTKATAEEYAAEEAGERDISEAVRLIDIPVPAGENGGIWDRRSDPHASAAELSEKLKEACKASYGAAMKRWLRLIEDEKVEASTLNKKAEWFLTKMGALSGPERRVAWKFAAIFAAGSLAIEEKILPWKRGFLRDVVITAWTRSQGVELERVEKGHADFMEALRTLEDYAKDDVRYPVFRGKERAQFPPHGSAGGFVRKRKSGRTLYLRNESLRVIRAPIIRALRKQGVISPESKQLWVMIGRREQRIRFTAVDLVALERLASTALRGSSGRH